MRKTYILLPSFRLVCKREGHDGPLTTTFVNNRTAFLRSSSFCHSDNLVSSMYFKSAGLSPPPLTLAQWTSHFSRSHLHKSLLTMSAAGSSSAAADTSDPSAQSDFVFFCIPNIDFDGETDTATPRLDLQVISAMRRDDAGDVDLERRRAIMNEVQASMKSLIAESFRSFAATMDSQFTEDTQFLFLVSLMDQWPTIEATAKSNHEGVNFSVTLMQGEAFASDFESEAEDNGGPSGTGPSGEMASVAEDSEEVPTDEGKGEQRAKDLTEESPLQPDERPQESTDTSGVEAINVGSNSDSEDKPTYKGKGKAVAED
jgi:hypothetical protein